MIKKVIFSGQSKTAQDAVIEDHIDTAFIEEHQLFDDYCALLPTLWTGDIVADQAPIWIFNSPDTHTVEWLIGFGKAPAGWTPKDAYPDIVDKDGLLASLLGLKDVQLWYSSVDFQGALWDAEAESDDAAQAVRTWASQIAPDWPSDLGLMRAGVNFTGQAEFLSSLDDKIRKQLGLDSALKVTGATGLDDYGLFIELAASITGANYSLLDGKLVVALSSIRARASGLDHPENVPAFQFVLVGHVSIEGSETQVTLQLSPKAEMLSVLVEPAKATACETWLKNLMPGVGSYLSPPDDTEGSWVPNLQRLHVVIPITGSSQAIATVVLGYDADLKLFKDLIRLRPTLKLRTDFTGAGTSAELTGYWIVGSGENEARFDVSLALPEGDAYIALAPGYRLNLPDRFNQVLAPILGSQSDLHVLDFELEGNIHDKSFVLTLVTRGFLNFDVNGSTVGLGDIEFSIDAQQDDWQTELRAVLALGRYTLALSAEIGESTEFIVSVPRVSLAELAEDLFKIDSPGEELQSAHIEQCFMLLRIGKQTHFKFSAASTAVAHIGGIEVHLKSIEVEYSKDDTQTSFSLRGAAQIKAGETTVDLNMEYESGTWRFRGDAKTHIDLTALINGMTKEIGFTSPFSTRAISVDSFSIDLRLGKAGTRLGIGCNLSIDNEKYALLLVAGKPVAEDGSAAAWQHFIQLKVPTIDLFKLPLVGGPLQTAARAARSITQDTGKVDVAGIDDLTFRLSSTCEEEELEALFEGLDSQAFPAPPRLGGKASVHADMTLIDYRKVIDYPTLKEKPAPLDAPTSEPEAKDTKEAKEPSSPTKEPAAHNDTKLPAKHTGKAATPAFAPPMGDDRGWWLPLDRSLGPVTFERIGVATDVSTVSFMIDASARLGPLKLGMVGLEAKTRIGLPIDPSFHLKGLTVGCTTEALRVSGGLVKREGNAYDGSVMIGFGKVTVSALGCYSETPATGQEEATPHLAIFAVLDAPLGGPPMFYVTGLAGGIGYNRAWTNMELAKLAEHPMISTLQKGAVDSGAIERFGQTSRLSKGDHWVAVGIKFTSFKIIEGVGILVLSLGEETRVNVLAKLDLTFPPTKALGSKLSPLVHADILIQAEYRPSAGELKVDGMLAPGSFLLSKDAVISGGFALYCWMDPSPHAGDFVLTLGGYHPSFKVPAHYPRVERLALNWQLSDQVQIKGEQYFALTPSAVMAGGLLQVNYRAGWGSASFKAQADFIIFFQPFAYAANVRIAVHVEAQIDVWPITLKLSLDLAVSMEIWGPPFGALARISFYGLSKDISLGETTRPALSDVSWSEFRSTFLPLANASERKDSQPKIGQAPTLTDSLITLTARSGLLARLNAKTGEPLAPGASAEETAAADWLVDPGTLAIDLALCIPATRLDVDGQERATGMAFGIGPMNITSQDLEVVVDVAMGNADKWVISSVRTSVAIGLWNPSGRPAAGALPQQQTLSDIMTGAQLTLENRPLEQHEADITSTHTEHDKTAFWVRRLHRAAVVDPDMSILRGSINTPEVNAQRQDLLHAIACVDEEIANRLAKRASRDGVNVEARTPTLKSPDRLERTAAPDSGLLVDAPRISRWGTQ